MDYGYPHPDDVTPEVQRMLDADAAQDAARARRQPRQEAPPMTANRAEQKGGGSMGIVTAEQRAALEAAGWRESECISELSFDKPYKDGNGTPWYASVTYDWRCERWDARGPLSLALEATAILGIAPPGYVMVPLEVARKGVYACEWASVNACARASTTASAADQKVYDDYRKHLHALVAFLKR